MRQWDRRRAKHLAADSQPPVVAEEQTKAEADAVGETAPPAQMRGEEREVLREAAVPVARHRGGGVLAPPSPEPGASGHGQEPPLRPSAISVPVVLTGSCRPVPGLASVPRTAAVATADTALPSSLLSDDRTLPLLRPGGGRLGLMRHHNQEPSHSAPGANSPSVAALVLLALLQIVLGCTAVLLTFGVLLLSSSSQLKNSCPFWASCSVILCGILGIVMWKKPIMVLAHLFILLSVICVLLNLAGFVLGHQGIQFVSSVPKCDLVDVGENKICFCCEEFQPDKCREESVLKLYHVKSCSLALVRLKKLLFGLCAMSVLTAIVCLSAAVLRYLQPLTGRGLYLAGIQTEDQDRILDPEDFIPPVPPPSYLSAFFSRTPQMSCRCQQSEFAPDVMAELVCSGSCRLEEEVFDPNTAQLVCTFRAQIRSAEVFSSVDPPPPYEAAQTQNSSEQGDAVQASVSEGSDLWDVSDRQSSQDLCYSDNFSNNDIPYYSNEETSECSRRVSFSLSNASLLTAGVGRRSYHPLKKWSKSDPVLHRQMLQGAMLHFELKKHNGANASFCGVTQQNSLRARFAFRGRPQSLVDLRDTKRPVMWISNHSCSVSSDMHGLVENTKLDAANSDTLLVQVMSPPQGAVLLDAPALPVRWQGGLLHMEGHCDLITSTKNENQLAERRLQEAEYE